MPTIKSSTESSGEPHRLQRAAVLFVVVAAHVVLILVLGRGARRPPEVLEIAFFPLPITPEDRPREPQRAVEPLAHARALNKSASPAHAPAQGATQSSEPISEPPPVADVPTESQTSPPIDWRAEVGATAKALEERARAKREQRAFASPGQSPYTRRNVKPECPFEQCEPNWGAGFSVFESQSSKKGRIEKTPDGEVIRWTSDRCYQILVTPNLMHRGVSKCQVPLGKSTARGDLFKHMHEAPPPEERATDVP